MPVFSKRVEPEQREYSSTRRFLPWIDPLLTIGVDDVEAFFVGGGNSFWYAVFVEFASVFNELREVIDVNSMIFQSGYDSQDDVAE